MSFYDELLTLGQHLHERERLALYRFLFETKNGLYKSDAIELIRLQDLKRSIANGEIVYSLNGNVVSYAARKSGSSEFQENLRAVNLSEISRFRIRKLIKFFAQSEVEVIWNPLQGRNLQEAGSYCILSYPYFDLRYFSNGRGRLIGLFNKLKIDDTDLRKKLKVS